MYIRVALWSNIDISLGLKDFNLDIINSYASKSIVPITKAIKRDYFYNGIAQGSMIANNQI